MAAFRRLVPDTLAGRFILLLATAILTANLIGLAVLSLQQQRFDRQAIEDRWITRIAALVPVLETVDAPTRQVIAREASNRHVRVRVEHEPLLNESAADRRSVAISNGLREALERGDVFAAQISRLPASAMQARDNGTPGRPMIAVTVPLSAKAGQPQWLNVIARGAMRHPGAAGIKSRPFLTFLGLSLLSVLGVGTVFASQLTRPLRQLSQAAQAAGRGDRSARVPEAGAREMREAARAFNAMQAEISQFDAERMRMIAAVGHDLRTPMTSLRIRAEMVEDDDQRAAMVRTLDEMTVMADGLVTYAKDGRDAEPMEPLDLEGLLSRICADRGAAYHGAPGLRILGRRVGLGRAIGNLIDNALRYGGAATVTLTQAQQHAVVTIDDTGPGIPEDRLEAMFHPFTRGDDSRSIATGGAGLGLAITRTIVLAHGGAITLENRAEGGLRATVRLPILK
ncbi:ATP-binding protein [Roseovarius dicentrarchi]|uniref:ATP-binding protein n=1 Tax=Roseovarius dicentrarchi TaxID=2250573 RepID=UPI0013967552|nr:ATP-binding protein [Roseovarius dicentrarchi]